MDPSRYVAQFDSASAMLRAVARFLHGKDFPSLGTKSLWRPVMAVSNIFPRVVRESCYILGGRQETHRPERLARLSWNAVNEWVTSHYPRRRYPAAMVGASSGAAVHLCCALGIPWLPQTLLVPVYHAKSVVPVDDFRKSLDFGREAAVPLLETNPDLHVYHMHDPNQDRLMIRNLAYFRVKQRRLGEAYRNFLEECVEPGGTLFLLDCRLRWPAVAAADRYTFQIGADGGATPQEYLHGGPRVAEFLERYGSDRRQWDPPEPDGEHVEAEWGFDAALGEDVEEFAARRGFRVRRIVFEEPQDLSAPVADLYRHWHRQRGIPANRLIVESFVLQEPWWTLRTGSVPFWTFFPVEPAANGLERELDRREAFDDLRVMLFSHGTESIGLAPIDRWQSILARARRCGRFAGVNPKTFPRDFAVFVRYSRALRREIAERHPLPEPLGLTQLDQFLDDARDGYPVKWD